MHLKKRYKASISASAKMANHNVIEAEDKAQSDGTGWHNNHGNRTIRLDEQSSLLLDIQQRLLSLPGSHGSEQGYQMKIPQDTNSQ